MNQDISAQLVGVELYFDDFERARQLYVNILGVKR